VAIQYVGGKVVVRAGNTTTTTTALNSGLTGGIASGVSAGDLVIAVNVVASNSDISASVSGYTVIGSEQYINGTYDTNLWVGYKFMPTTPDTAVTIPSAGSIDNAQGFIVMVFRGVDPSTPLGGVTPVFSSKTTSLLVDPPSITPTIAGSFVVAVGGAATTGGSDTFASSDLTDFLTNGQGDTYDVVIGAGHKDNWTSGAFNPAQWTCTQGDNLNYTCIGGTFVLSPPVTRTLTANDVESASEMGTKPALGVIRNLTATDVASLSELTKPVVGQVQVITANDVASASELGTKPALGVIRNLTATDVASASELSNPAATQVVGAVNLTANDVSSSSELTKPVLRQGHALTANDVASASEVKTATLGVKSNLTAVDVESASELSKPVIHQRHTLDATNVESASELKKPALVQNVAGADNLFSRDVESNSELTKPQIAQKHAVTASDVESASELSKPSTGQPSTRVSKGGIRMRGREIGDREERHSHRGVLKLIRSILKPDPKRQRQPSPAQIEAAAQAVIDYPEDIDFEALSRDIAKMVEGVQVALSRTELAHRMLEVAELQAEMDEDDEEVIMMLADLEIDSLFNIEGL
jgi:hypothetical protein